MKNINNFKNPQINQVPTYQFNQSNNFLFNLGQVNKIKPKQLRKLDIIHLIRSNNIPELKETLNDLSQENFAENDYFEFKKDELKLIKAYQILMQYYMNEINQLEEKNQVLSDFIDKQLDNNEAAVEVLDKQNKKIRNQNEDIDKIIYNCKNMQFLVDQLGLNDRQKELGIHPLNYEMKDKDMEYLRAKMNNLDNLNNNNINSNINNSNNNVGNEGEN